MTTEAIAREFAKQLTSELGPAILAEIIAKHATEEYRGDVCASHDYCDANMVMESAFTALGIPVWIPDGYLNDSILDQWNAAWTLAKDNNFYL